MENNQNVNSLMKWDENVLIITDKDNVFYCGDYFKKHFHLTESSPLTDVLKAFQGTVKSQFDKIIKDVRFKRNPIIFTIKEYKNKFVAAPFPYGENWIVVSFDQLNKKLKPKQYEMELDCIYKITEELNNKYDINNVLESSINYILEPFGGSDKAKLLIELKPKKYFGNLNIKDVDKEKTFEFLINSDKKTIGRIVIAPSSKYLEYEKEKFLKEIAFILSAKLERLRIKRKLERRRTVFIRKNKKFLEVAEECGTSRKKLQAVLNAITDNLIVIGNDYRIIRSNNEKIKSGELCHKAMFSDDEKCENCPSEITFSSSKASVSKLRKGEKHFVIRSYPILDDFGNVERVVETCADVSEHKLMENQLFQSYKLASIGKLVAGVAHEINNPNTFIRGNVKIIKEAFNDIFPILDKYHKKNSELKLARLNYSIFKEHIPQLIEDMDHGTDRINKIVLGLRNFAKKNDDVLNENVNLNELLKNNLRITKKEILKNAKIKENLDANLPEFKGNKQKIEQVLMNLLSNAAQAIKGFNGLISITTTFNKNEVILIVNDNGIGMDTKTQKHMFDPFYTTKRNRGGTGLGLSILYGIISEHKGKVEVESAIGEGTTFKITFPLNKGE